MPEPVRRTLTFATLDDVMPEVERLLAGHTTIGRWTLAEMCSHLATTIGYTVDGFPRPWPPWIVRKLIGPRVVRHVLKSGRMPAGIKAPAMLAPRPGVDARAAAEALRAAIARFDAAADPLPLHPFFDRLSHADAERLQCIHCAHHLSFALPAEAHG